jgi:SNF2 family DNA or RNA helicase
MAAVKIFPDRRAVVLPARTDVLRLVPQAKAFVAQGQNFMALPHAPETTRLLRNLGVRIPEPIRYYYDWVGTTPFTSQIDTAALLTTFRRAFVLNEMGTGKTRASLFAFDFLRKFDKAKRLLVVAPLSTLVGVWEDEVFRNFHHLTTAVLYGSKAKRRQLLAGGADVLIINHDGVETIQSELGAAKIDCIIIDELAMYRNSQTDRWKTLKPLVRRATHAWGLTGAPTPNSPTDAYGQVKLLVPENVGFSFKSFKDATMLQVSQFTWVEREDANDHVFKAMQPSIRVTRDQAFDLPPVTYSNRNVVMDPRSAEAYKNMHAEMAALVRSKEITAANEGVKLSKLLQISAGFAYDGDREGNYIGAKDRIKEVFDIIEESSRKVIVFAPFRYLTEVLAKALGKRWPVAMVHGGVTKGVRDKIFTDFQHSASPRVIVAHPGTMAHGLNLTRADTIVWAAPTLSLETYEQANARITRPGQSTHAHIIHIMSTKAEAKVYSRLRNRAKMQGALLEMFNET